MRKLENFIRDESESIDISPLIDMVFILLIFFVVATSFIDEKGVTIGTINSIDSTVNLSEPFEVSLLNSGEMLFGKRSVSITALQSMLEAAATLTKQPLILKIEDEVTSEKVVSVMDTAVVAGLGNVSLKSL